MLNINVLPEELKRGLKTRELYCIFKKMMFLIFLISIFLSVFVIFGKIIINMNNDTAGSALSLDNKNSPSERVKVIEETINFVQKIEKESVDWSRTLEDLLLKVNQDITIYSLAMDKDSNKISLKGNAKTRDALLLFKNSLEDSDNYSNIDFPVKNLLEKENINFDINMDVIFYEHK